MTPHAYGLLVVAIATGFAALAVWAFKSGGTTRLTLAWLAASLLIGVLGYFDWHRLAVKETPLRAYVVTAFIPTLVAALFVAWRGGRKDSLILQFSGAAAICWVLIQGTSLLAM